jgi:hypothetical protein
VVLWPSLLGKVVGRPHWFEVAPRGAGTQWPDVGGGWGGWCQEAGWVGAVSCPHCGEEEDPFLWAEWLELSVSVVKWGPGGNDQRGRYYS